MFRVVSLSCTGFALLIGVSISAGPANAVVYCKTVGVPKGCVARPAVAAPVVVAPVASPVVVCKTRGVPKVALCDDCLWHETDVPSRRTCVIAARSTASAGADRRIAHHASLRLAADINRCSRGRKLTEIANFTPGQGMEQLKHGMGSRH